MCEVDRFTWEVRSTCVYWWWSLRSWAYYWNELWTLSTIRLIAVIWLFNHAAPSPLPHLPQCIKACQCIVHRNLCFLFTAISHQTSACHLNFALGHYDDVIMSAMASQITSLPIVYSTVYSGANQSEHQSSASLAFVWGIHRGPVNSPHKWPVTRKMFQFDDVIKKNASANGCIHHLNLYLWCCFSFANRLWKIFGLSNIYPILSLKYSVNVYAQWWNISKPRLKPILSSILTHAYSP